MDPTVCVVGDPAGKQVPQNEAETPSSLGVSETACRLKQGRLLFPPTVSHSLTPPTEGDTPKTTPTATPIQLGVAGASSNCSSPLESNGADTPKIATTVISNTLTRVQRTRKEREVLRLEIEKLRAEALEKKEKERLEKEAAMLKREVEKKARRERREREEREKRERREARERERREKQEKRELERVHREEGERKRRDEKKKAEIEKLQSAEEKIRKQHKEQELFSSFFSKLPKTESQTNETSEKGTGLRFDASLLDQALQSQTTPTSSYLTRYRSRRLRTNKPRPLERDDVIMMSSPAAPPRPRMKLLQFHSNVRPAYFGSWSKRSRSISGRAPFKMDKGLLDYEFDSEEEWEEGEPGESVSSASEGEESGGDESGEEGEEDGFFVPHGYLSEDEGERSENEGEPTGTQMDKVKAKAKAWEAEFQRKCQPKKPVCIGCVWVGGGEGGEVCADKEFLAQFSALVLTDTPVRVDPPTTTTISPDTHSTSATDTLKRPVPEEAMPDLIRLVNQSTAGLAKLVKTFQTHWGAVLHNRTTTTTIISVTDGGAPRSHSPKDRVSPERGSQSPLVITGAREGEGENRSGISKRQLERRIQFIAVKEVRSPSTKPTWYVHDSVFEQYKLDPSNLVPLLPPTPRSSAAVEKSNSPETVLSTPVGRKGSKRRATVAGSTPTLFEVIARSPQTGGGSAGNSAQKRLKLASSSATGSLSPATGSSSPATGLLGREEPPKKRIKLETVSFKSQLPAVRGGVVNGEGGGSGEVIAMDTSSSNDPTVQSSRNSHTNTPSRRISPAVVTNPTCKSGTLTSEDEIGTHTCLQEVTNNSSTAGTVGNSEGRGLNGENGRPYIDWPKLLSANANSNQVTVIADIH